MNTHDLEQLLFNYTESEKRHLVQGGVLSERYKQLSYEEIDDKRIYYFKFLDNLSDTGVYLMKESRFTPILAHKHDVIEISYIYAGQATQIIDGVRYTLKKGDVVLLDTHAVHEILPLSDQDIVLTIVTRRSNILNNILARLDSQGLLASFLSKSLIERVTHMRHLVFKLEDDPLHALIQEFMLDFMNNASPEILNSYMVILYSRLSQLIDCIDQSHLEDTPIYRQDMLEILTYIEAHPTEQLGNLAARFNYNEAYLGNLIRKMCGRSFREITQERRMELARVLLASTQLPVYAIAEQLGYKNLGFFYKKFASTYGCTPQTFREQLMQADQ